MPTTRNLNDIVNSRRIIDGPSDKLRAVSAIRYPWAASMFDEMCSNNWDFKQVSLVRDRSQFQSLPKGQQTAYKRSLAFLSNLDSIQVDNLALNVSQVVTDPNIRECLYRQEFEEVIHVKAYSAIIESVFPEDPMMIYDMYHVVPQLGNKNDYIINTSAEVSIKPTPINKAKALVSNIALEGIYFFSGFTTFYAIGRNTGEFQGTVDQIKYIQRDEVTHLQLFANIINALKLERPELFEPSCIEVYRNVLKSAAELEIAWGKFVIEEGVPGLNDQIITEFIQHRANVCSSMLDFGEIYPGVKNPIDWFYTFSNINSTQQNFFETKPQTYSEAIPQFTSRRSRARMPLSTATVSHS